MVKTSNSLGGIWTRSRRIHSWIYT